VLTDSGSIIKETTMMGVPCMTECDSTESPESATIGTHGLLGTDPAALPLGDVPGSVERLS